ncbi:MAG: helix-turn-helix domain-containing protein [Bacilli bacterium]|nr:helix-turn-helix domain-containing protein [Bacilli bacterium]
MNQKIKLMKYEIVPLTNLRGLNLNSTDKLVMGLIVSLTAKRNKCTASNEFLAEQLEFKKRTITKSIAKLKEKNLITVRKVNYQREIYSNIVWNDSAMGIDQEYDTL